MTLEQIRIDYPDAGRSAPYHVEVWQDMTLTDEARFPDFMAALTYVAAQDTGAKFRHVRVLGDNIVDEDSDGLTQDERLAFEDAAALLNGGDHG